MYIGEFKCLEEGLQRRKTIYELRNGFTGLETRAFNATRLFHQEIEPILKEPLYRCDKFGLYMHWRIEECHLCVHVNNYCFYLFTALPQKQSVVVDRFEYDQIKQMVAHMNDCYNNVNKLSQIY